MIERLAAENKRAERNYQFRESIKQKHIRGEDFFSFTFCWNNQAEMIKEMKWKKKKKLMHLRISHSSQVQDA